jgi:fructokinase
MLKVIIVTRGGEGCLVYENDTLHEVGGVEVKVKDTVGAGDSFSAAFMHFYLKSGDPVKAATRANELGAFVAGSRGAVPEYSEELQWKLSGN